MHRLLGIVFLTACSGSLALDSSTSEPDGGQTPIDATASMDSTVLDATAPPPGALTFAQDILPMFDSAGCTAFACHGGILGGSAVFAYLPNAEIGYRDLIERRSIEGPNVEVRAFAPDESALVSHAETTLRSMGLLDDTQIARVRTWVEQGAFFSRGEVVDGGGPEIPDGGVLSECSLAGLRGVPPLPGSCLPRCTTDTWNAVVACRSMPDVAMCQQQVESRDGTAAVVLGGGFDPSTMLDCTTCLILQTNSCLSSSCTLTLLDLVRCIQIDSTAPCTAERAALNSCAGADPGFRDCQQAREMLCVAP